MANVGRKRKYFPRRQKSFDFYSSDEVDAINGNQHFNLNRLKSIDEKDSTDLKLERPDKDSRVKASLSDGIKLAAIYDDEAEIIRILSSVTNMPDGELPELLSSYMC